MTHFSTESKTSVEQAVDEERVWTEALWGEEMAELQKLNPLLTAAWILPGAWQPCDAGKASKFQPPGSFNKKKKQQWEMLATARLWKRRKETIPLTLWKPEKMEKNREIN